MTVVSDSQVPLADGGLQLMLCAHIEIEKRIHKNSCAPECFEGKDSPISIKMDTEIICVFK